MQSKGCRSMVRRALDEEQRAGNTNIKGVSNGRRNPKEMEKEV